MSTTKKLAGLALLCHILLFVQACDNELSPKPLGDQENNLNTTDSLNDPSALAEDKITLYEVDGEDIIKIQDYEVEGQLIDFQKDSAKHQEIWQLVKKIIPADYRVKLNEFLIYHGAKTNTSAFVDPTINNLSKWQFAIAIDYAYRKPFNSDGEVTFTIIHELGHILTLNNEQLQAGILVKNCSNYFVDQGCATNEAYINTFYNRFWLDISEEFNSLEKTSEANTLFYQKYLDRFVSEYAATSPREDIAEIFATFVTEAEVRKGTSIADQKIQMMYGSAELRQLRSYIRENNLSAE